MSDLRIVSPTAADIATIVGIERQAFSDPWSEASFRQLLGNPAVFFACAREGDAGPVLGYVVAWFAADEAEIANLAVVAGARRRGVGNALLRAALRDAGPRGARTIYLEVRDSNEQARRLYGAEGFAEIGRRRGYYRRPVEDAIVLCKELGAPPSEGDARVK